MHTQSPPVSCHALPYTTSGLYKYEGYHLMQTLALGPEVGAKRNLLSS
jgi:hypothetical protein